MKFSEIIKRANLLSSKWEDKVGIDKLFLFLSDTKNFLYTL